MAKTWLITGSGRGLGRHIAEAVLAAGDNLLATARDTAQLARCCVSRPAASAALARASAASAGAVKPARIDRSVSRAVSARERVSRSATASCRSQARSPK